MKDIDLDKFKLAWNEEMGFDAKILSESELNKYLNKRSKGITSSFKISLVIDIVLKFFLEICFIFLISLYSNHIVIITLCSILSLLICYFLFIQFKMYGRLPRHKEYSHDIRTFLESIIKFYRTEYIKSMYIFALSNPLILVGGSLLYFHFKYSEIRSLDFNDFFVFSLICIIGFIIGIFTQTKQYNFQIRQLEECLSELEDKGINELTLRKQKKRQRILFLLLMIILILGLSVLGYILIL